MLSWDNSMILFSIGGKPSSRPDSNRSSFSSSSLAGEKPLQNLPRDAVVDPFTRISLPHTEPNYLGIYYLPIC